MQTPLERADFVAVAGGDERVGAWRKQPLPAKHLTVYIEGDGAPWPSAAPPTDPTPRHPYALKLAQADASDGVAYLGRPCQYLNDNDLARCAPDLWRRQRYSATALAAMSASLDALKQQAGAETLALVGYSGGGAAAVLLAAQRKDVRCLVTIAAPLDTAAWTQHLGVAALLGRNPQDVARHIQAIPQTHFAGADDTVVPPATTQSYFRGSGALRVLPGHDHACCWAAAWPMLKRETCLQTPI